MKPNIHERILTLEKEKKSLYDSPKKRELQLQIDKLKKELQSQKGETYYRILYVKRNGENIGTVQFDDKENAYIFCDPGGSRFEVGVSYQELRHWTIINGYTLKADDLLI